MNIQTPKQFKLNLHHEEELKREKNVETMQAWLTLGATLKVKIPTKKIVETLRNGRR